MLFITMYWKSLTHSTNRLINQVTHFLQRNYFEGIYFLFLNYSSTILSYGLSLLIGPSDISKTSNGFFYFYCQSCAYFTYHDNNTLLTWHEILDHSLSPSQQFFLGFLTHDRKIKLQVFQFFDIDTWFVHFVYIYFTKIENVCYWPLIFFYVLFVKKKLNFWIRQFVCLRYRTTLRFDFLNPFMVCLSTRKA